MWIVVYEENYIFIYNEPTYSDEIAGSFMERVSRALKCEYMLGLTLADT